MAGETWRLIQKKNLDYFSTRRYEDLDKKISNWLVFTKYRPRTEGVISRPAVEEKPQETPDSEVMERLKTLEALKLEGLVTDEEYRRKRKQILDGL